MWIRDCTLALEVPGSDFVHAIVHGRQENFWISDLALSDFHCREGSN
jgi:hypothetical protein